MDTLGEVGEDTALAAQSMDQIGRELREQVRMVLDIGVDPNLGIGDMSIWYVLAKAGGSTGYTVPQLLNCPTTRRYAIGCWLVDAMAASEQQKEFMTREQQRE